jgi:hypothetical protein
MKTTFLTLLIALTACKGDAKNFTVSDKNIDIPVKINNHISRKQINGITEIENNDFIISTLNQKVNYETIKNSFSINTVSEKSIVNIHDNTMTDKEITVSLLNDTKTNFSYYLTNAKNILLKGIIYSTEIELMNGIKVGNNINKIEQLFGCVIEKTLNNKFRIFDSDGLIEIIINFNDLGNITYIEINTSGYVS